MTTAPNFGSVAETYARMRPGYPPEVFDDLVALSSVPEHGRILEIGAGTGQATLPLAQRGYRITAVEPDEALVHEGRRALAAFPAVTFHVSRFEDWPLPDEPFDLVLAATAFHWLDPSVRYAKSAVALRPGGCLAVVHTHHVAGGDQAFFDDVQACYARFMPGTSNRRLLLAEVLEPATHELVASDLYQAPEVRRYLWLETYAAGQYTDLLSTYSDHIALEPAARHALFGAIEDLIDSRYRGSIRKQYMTDIVVARKR